MGSPKLNPETLAKLPRSNQVVQHDYAEGARRENGVLTWVPGDYISQGMRQLPKARAEEKDAPERQVLVPDVPSMGAVRITYQLRDYCHGRSRFWHWVARRADLIAEPDVDAS